MRRSYPFFIHLIPSTVLVTMVTGVLLYLSSYKDFNQFYLEQVQDELAQQAQLFVKCLAPLKEDSLNPTTIDSLTDIAGKNTSIRYTVIRNDGLVLGDSDEDPSVMNNHKSRPEVVRALMGDTGVSIRYSATLDRDYMYLAIPQGDAIIRCSIPLKQVNKLLTSFKSETFRALIIALIAAILLGILLARHMSRPIEELKRRSQKLATGDFTPHAPIKGSSEIVELSQTMEQTAKELNRRFTQVQYQRERLRTILTGMIEGVIAFDTEEKIYLINDAAAALFTTTPQEAQGMLIQEAVRSVAIQQIVHTLLDENSTGEHIVEEVTLPVGALSHTLTIHGTRLDRGRGCLLVLHDITEVKRLENLRKDFAGNVSHELRTPLTVIKGFVETLEEGALEDEKIARHFLTIIHEHVDRLNELIEDLLKISQLEKESEEGSVTLINEPLELLLTKVVADKESVAQKKNCTLLFTPCKSSVEAPINSSLFEQALVNLIDNAIKYSPEGSTISLSLTQENDFVQVKVQDNGVGIAAEHLPRLFERFYRVDTGRNRAIGGTGLGLSIVKHIVGIHNGSITVESEVGKGSTFVITLPASSPSSSSPTKEL